MKLNAMLILIGTCLAVSNNLNAQKTCETAGNAGAAIGAAVGREVGRIGGLAACKGAAPCGKAGEIIGGAAGGYLGREYGISECQAAKERKEYERRQRENEAGRPKETPGMTREQKEATRREQRLENLGPKSSRHD